LRTAKTNEDTHYRYGYQGQYAEADEETGWNSFELRNYDSKIGKWLSPDPAGQFASPYNGMGNNPVNGVDPDGAWVKGAGLFNNLFKSDSRIYSEQYASSWSSDFTDYSAHKAGDAWGVMSIDKMTSGGSGWYADRYTSFSAVDSDGNVGGTSGGFMSTYTGPAPGTTNLAFELQDVVLGATGGLLIGKSVGFLAGRLTTADGFLFRGFTVRTPVNIPVQGFGNMSLGRSDFWGLRIGAGRFTNRTFAAIKPSWNPLTQYTTGVIPRGTPIKFGIIGPQGLRYPGGSFQFIAPSRNIIGQSSKIIAR
jgi:RHS repeat-associated protein